MRERPRSVFQMKVERVFAGLPEEADEHEKKYVPLFKRPFFCFRLFGGRANFFSDVFRSYMS